MRRGASRVARRSVTSLAPVGALVQSCVSRVPTASDKPFRADADDVPLWNQAEREEEQIER